jgi:hypothetical protein
VATFFVFWTEDKKNSAVDIEHWGKTSWRRYLQEIK